MAVIIKEGNVFDSDADIICHQVNCQGVMGSGVAKEVRERFLNVYEQYHELCELHKDYTAGLLGTAQIIPVYGGRKELYIANCFGQDKYGYNGAQYTSIGALMEAFVYVAEQARQFNWKVAMPYKIGCCRGGADWDTVKKIIDTTFQGIDVELWKLEEK